MGGKKKRITSKIDELPEDIRIKVDFLLADTKNSYEDISQFLKEQGSNRALQRLMEAQVQTNKLVEAIREKPDADYTEAAIMLTMNGLVNRMATAEEEFDSMPLDKAGRLIASLSRTKVYKDRVRQEMRKKADIAFGEMEAEMMKVIKEDPESVAHLKTMLQKAKERMMQDD